jgi:DNA-binding YbaB/EbfC family protein
MFNMQQIMKQAQNMQKKVADEQAKLDKEEFEGGAANNLIKIKMSGNHKALSISIDPTLIVSEDKETLEDLIIVAINDVNSKIEKRTEEVMNGATGGIKLPF